MLANYSALLYSQQQDMGEKYIQRELSGFDSINTKKTASGLHARFPEFGNLSADSIGQISDEFSVDSRDGKVFTPDTVGKIRRALKMFEISHDSGEEWTGGEKWETWELRNGFYSLILCYEPVAEEGLGGVSLEINTAEETDNPITPMTSTSMVVINYSGISRVSGYRFKDEIEEYGAVTFSQFPQAQDPERNKYLPLLGDTRTPEVSSGLTLYSNGQMFIVGDVYPQLPLSVGVKYNANVVYDAIKDKAKDRVQRLKNGLYGKSE